MMKLPIIVPIGESEQESKITEYNQAKPLKDRIALVPRNLFSGWPLLQVSLFTVAEDEDAQGATLYEPVLGGGKCHDIDLPALGFARLLLKVPGRKILSPNNAETLLNSLDIERLLDTPYSIQLPQYELTVSTERTSFGYLAELILPQYLEGSLHYLGLFSRHTQSFALKSRYAIQFFGVGYEPRQYTEEQLRLAVNHRVAIFKDGQILIDFGELLESIAKTPVDAEALKRYFAHVFKVKEFQSLFVPPNYDHERVGPIVNYLISLERSVNALQDHAKEIRAEIRASNREGNDRRASAEINRIAKPVEDLVVVLRDQISQFAEQVISSRVITSVSLEQYKAEFEALLHSQDAALKEHRAYYKIVAVNAAIGATGVGLFALAGRAIYSKFKPKTHAVFFAQTKREHLVAEVDAALAADKI